MRRLRAMAVPAPARGAPWRCLLAAVALAASAAVASPAAADVVELRDGRRIEGTVVEVSATTVRVEVGGPAVTVDRAAVRAIYMGVSAATAPPGTRAAVDALRGLRSTVTAGVNRREYGARLQEAEKAVDGYLEAPSAPGDADLRAAIQASMRYYRIVADAWSPSSRDRGRVRVEPLLDECAGFKELAVADSLLPGSVSVPLPAAISVLWGCAGARLDEAELILSGVRGRGR